MKKVRFGDVKALLSKDEMRQIKGGSGSCGVKLSSGQIWCGMSKSAAVFVVSTQGGYWCCDSCRSYCA